ncbi:MAG: NUDIX hydrolase [Emergencia sp.]|nr:NUDIX hydrolase [Emergencia sp.]
MNPKLRNLSAVIADFVPGCEQEERDRELMLRFLRDNDNCLMRENLTAHFTASSWIVNGEGRGAGSDLGDNVIDDKILMVYHNLYNSWSWTGGHADGEADLLSVAIREAQEETGVQDFKVLHREPISLEIITVDGHMKRGVYVPSHLHLNLTYLLQADETQKLSVKPDENSGVAWIPAGKLAAHVSEPWMMKWVYEKLMGRV